LPEPGTAGCSVQRLRGGVSHTSARRHELGGQGVRGVPDPDAGRAYPVAVRRCWRHHARSAARQPVRAG